MSKQYTGKDIEVLTDREHVRLRTQIYLGSTNESTYEVPLFIGKGFEVKQFSFIPAVYKAVGEIIDNSIDEFAHVKSKERKLTIDADPLNGHYVIADNGRGIPIDKHETGRYTPEVALGSLRAGRNFHEKEAGVIGQNGVGSACTNFCSTEFEVTIHRDGKVYKQRWFDGAETVSKPQIRKTSVKKTGTEVSMILDGDVFRSVQLPEELMNNRAFELAFTNPGVTVEYNKTKYKFRRGLEDVVSDLAAYHNKEYCQFKFAADDLEMEFYVVFDMFEDVDEHVFTWVNSSFLFDGGTCNTQFLNSFYDHVIKHLQSQAKKAKVELTKNDIRQNILVLANIKLSNPEYDAQSKTRLTGPSLRKQIDEMVSSAWRTFARKNKEWLERVLDRAIQRAQQKANKKAIQEHNKLKKKKVPGLIDATGKDRSQCQLLITEGLSAASMITEVRNPATTATFPLTGKINNVYGSTVAQVLKMGKVTNLLTAIGLTPGQKTHPGDLNYGKIVIATDSDYDGDDIFTLLVNLFYEFWPELFNSNNPVVHRLIAPNVCLAKGNKRVHFPSRSDYESKKEKYKGWEVNYFKGLGSMEREDWEMILNGATQALIPVYDDGKMKDTLRVLFSDDANARKQWLQEV